MLNREYALVLSGGGAKGSYQIGVWKALREFKIKINAIIGSSVGALNGIMIILNEYEKSLNLWENISIDKVVSIPKEILENGRIDIKRLSVKKIIEIQKEIFKTGGFDIKPLEDLIISILDENKVRESGIDFGLVTYDVNSFKPLEIFIEDIPYGKLKDYLLATSTLPGFKITKIENKKYLDGGLYDNIPIDLAKRRGYKNIIVIDISGLGFIRKINIDGTNTIYIKNSSDTGNIIDFNPSISKRNITMGYLDTLKVFGQIDGIEYFISNKNKEKIVKEILAILKSDYTKDIFKSYVKIKYNSTNINIERLIREILPEDLKFRKDIVIPLVESAAKVFNIEKIKLYDLKELIEMIWNKYTTIDKSSDLTKNKIEEIIEKTKNFLKNSKKNEFSLLEYENFITHIFSVIGIKKENSLNKVILKLFPHLLPAKFFCEILRKYFV